MRLCKQRPKHGTTKYVKKFAILPQKIWVDDVKYCWVWWEHYQVKYEYRYSRSHYSMFSNFTREGWYYIGRFL